MAAKLSIRHLSVRGKRVLVRVDFNVPIEGSCVTDDTRIVESLPTLLFLREKRARIILLAHLGRPGGKPVAGLSLEPVFKHLRKLLDDSRNIFFCPECIGPLAEAAVLALKDGDILLLENVRFHAGEEANNSTFSAELAQLGEIYINDAFGAAHRAHASTVGISSHLPFSATGLLVEKELYYLQGQLESPKRPFLVLLGGSKVSDKIGVIEALMERADKFLIGGAMAYTFLKVQGIPVGDSLVEVDDFGLAGKLLTLSKDSGVELLLPLDAVETLEIQPGAVCRNTPVFSQRRGVTRGWIGVDIGVKTRALYSAEIARAATILWNGPLGVFEIREFSSGTRIAAEAIAANSLSVSIIGGGDSVAAVRSFDLGNKMTFLSTGGGASLRLLEGRPLPGIDTLTEKK
ncbi:Bifunctional PGK/TIM [Candidatus Xiphinematobacter sp. Idaho Grape]|uniref:phosphoglycerate kinase n=1 Tax=Candidatus Xiphinematobacter sp. Idaho Grape TaxID=1704307 RepID=UPI00070591BE|nr:phosphoglycerate kinase [Candidatus Xiphinematobacter sp. Idaho Grape]ALJ56914.1 Bifunctional PGK/TIM [Candidatus Xiphinematobacter sp. Idaho Grape]